MLNYYNLSRTELVKLIKSSNRTLDGNYWFPRFLELNLEKGKQNDTGYYYEREYFKYKMYFTRNDIKTFLSKKKVRKFDIDELYRKSCMFYDTNKELFTLDINDFIPGRDYKLCELIDCFEYIYSTN